MRRELSAISRASIPLVSKIFKPRTGPAKNTFAGNSQEMLERYWDGKNLDDNFSSLVSKFPRMRLRRSGFESFQMSKKTKLRRNVALARPRPKNTASAAALSKTFSALGNTPRQVSNSENNEADQSMKGSASQGKNRPPA